MGWITRGISALRTPGREPTKTAEDAEDAEDRFIFFSSSAVSATPSLVGPNSFFLLLRRNSVRDAGLLPLALDFDFDDFFSSASSVPSVVFIRLLSATATLFFSQSTFEDAAALRLLSHSAEPLSPAISCSERFVSTDQSSFALFASKPSLTPSSRFLMSNHSVPLLPGRRERIRARTNSPFNFFPLSRNFRSPFASNWCGSPRGSHVPTSHT